MPKQIVIAEQHRIAAVFSEDQIQEIIVATGSHQVGDIYLGTVENILPSIDAAFINIGDKDKNGFMHVSDLGPLKLKRMAGPITELIVPQQKVLVQIMKEPTGNKGPRLTGKVTLPGRYLVLMPYGKGVNLSRRIRTESERNRLRALGILVKPPGMGLLIRTEAEGVSEDAIIEDLEALQRSWESVQAEAMATRPPSLLNRDDDFIQRVLRDVYSDDVNRIVTDTESGFERTRKHLTSWSDDSRVPTGILLDYHKERTPILEYFRVNAAIREALKPRVDLPSGGYIIIEPTEALTVIDVNSGSFTRSATARETVLWTNCEAAVEIARQMRLRNIAGVIVVDFIDMDTRRDQMQVLEMFGKAIRPDKSRPQISQLSELGLVELTRKRQGQNIYELFGQTCPTCGGLGHLAHVPGEEPVAAVQLSAVPTRGTGYSSPSQSFSNRPSAKESNNKDKPISLDPQSEPQELDLMNHPSYQDKNGRGGRRRRRQRPDGRSESRSESRSDSRSESGPSRGRRASGSPANPITVDRDKSDRSVSRRDKITTQSEELTVEVQEPNDNGAVETAVKTKRTRNSRRKPEEPPEIIAVEMTEEQQRIYAVMGVSPLVLSEQTVENSQNVLISVVLPGEAAAFMEKARSEAQETADLDEADDEEKAPPQKRVIETPSRLENEDPADVENDSKPASSENRTAAPILNGNDDNSDDDDESSSDAPVRRRKRSTSRKKPSVDEIANPAEAVEPIAAPKKAVSAAPSAPAEEIETEEEEPVVRRRRRRRSSASE